MSDQGTSPAASPAAGRPSPFLLHTFWKFALVIAIIMVALALLGVGLSAARSAAALTYWTCLVPVYGMACVATAWRRPVGGKPFDSQVVVRQLLHWLGIGVALGLDFLIRGTGEETGMTAGLNALLLLALGCYLAGIHLEWLFVLVGLLLTVVLILVAKADQYLWLVFVVGGIAIAAMLAFWWYLGVHARKRAVVMAAHSAPAGS